MRRSRVRFSSCWIEALSGPGVVPVITWLSCNSCSSGNDTNTPRRCCVSIVKCWFLTIVSNHAFTLDPRRESNPLNARKMASCSRSSASLGECVNHRANPYAASRCGNTSSSKRRRLSSMEQTAHHFHVPTGVHQSSKTLEAHAIDSINRQLHWGPWTARNCRHGSTIGMSITGVLPKPFLLAESTVRLCLGPSDEIQASLCEQEGCTRVLLRKFLENLLHFKDWSRIP